jgi:2-iminobutanoate/2-iminopropanoate deaminase
VAAQGPFDPQTGKIAGTDIESQTRRTLTNIKAIVEASGLTLRDVVMVWVFLRNAGDSDRMDEVYSTFFPDNPPARTVLAAPLPIAGVLIAADAVASHST